MFTGGGDGVRVSEDGHPASHRPNTAGSSLAFGNRYEGRTVMVAARLMTLFIIWSRRAGVLALSFRTRTRYGHVSNVLHVIPANSRSTGRHRPRCSNAVRLS